MGTTTGIKGPSSDLDRKKKSLWGKLLWKFHFFRFKWDEDGIWRFKVCGGGGCVRERARGRGGECECERESVSLRVKVSKTDIMRELYWVKVKKKIEKIRDGWKKWKAWGQIPLHCLSVISLIIVWVILKEKMSSNKSESFNKEKELEMNRGLNVEFISLFYTYLSFFFIKNQKSLHLLGTVDLRFQLVNLNSKINEK